MRFFKEENDKEDIEELSFFQFLVIKRIDYTKNVNKLAKSLGHYYYSYCRTNGYISQDLKEIGCPRPMIFDYKE